jgi:subtilase family serine protease
VVGAEVPEALGPLVVGFVSLSNISPHPMLSGLVAKAQPRGGTAPDGATSSGPVPNDTEGGEYYVGAQDFYTIYNETPLLTGGTTGAGVTVALLEETDINTADVTAFRTMLGVSPATPALTAQFGMPSGPCTDPGITSTGEESEAVLDAEWAGAAAPGATLLFMSCATTTTAGIFLSAEEVIENNLATTMSLSYGSTEVNEATTDQALSNLWEEATAQGQTVVISAGDAGSANSADQDKSIARHGLAVNGYASTAYNVAAGGKDFQDLYNQYEGDSGFEVGNYWLGSNGSGGSSALSYVPETPWNNTCASSIMNNYYADGNPDPNALCNSGHTAGAADVAERDGVRRAGGERDV